MLRPPVHVCFICSGNICRSPTASVVLDRIAHDTDRDYLLAVDSAGTGAWHEGEDMDGRARRTMSHAGYDVAPHTARQFQVEDFASRDILVALDSGHLHALWWLAAQTDDPGTARSKLVLLREFDPQLEPGEQPDVVDPYYGGGNGFADVLHQCERSCAALLDAIEQAVITSAPTVMSPSAQRTDDQQTDNPPL